MNFFKMGIAALFLLGSMIGNAQKIIGDWKGTITMEDNKMDLIIHVKNEAGVYNATLDIPMQGASGLPIDKTEFVDNKFSFKLSQFQINYTAELKGEVLEGTFSQSGVNLPLTFNRFESKLPGNISLPSTKIDTGKITRAVKIKGSTFTKVNFPEIDTVATELLALEAKLGLANSGSYISNFTMYVSDNPLTLSNIDGTTMKQLFLFFESAGMLESVETETESNIRMFDQYTEGVESIAANLTYHSFGHFAFEKFNYRFKNSKKAKQFFKNYGNIKYKVSEIDRKNQLIQKLIFMVDNKMTIKPFKSYYLSASMEDSSNTHEHVYFWISDKILVAIRSFVFL